MINKINSVGNVKVFSNLNFKSEEKIVSKPTEEREYDAKPLANYAMASIDFKNKLKVTPLIPTIYLPEAVDSIKGERIYNSNGDLYAIIDENDETKIVYKPVKGRDDAFESIVTTDKKTGKIIKEQNNKIEGNEHKEISIRQFSPETGDEIAYTKYEDGALEWASKTLFHKDGSVTEVTYDYEDKEYRIYETSKNGNVRRDLYMSEDMKFITINTSIETKGKRTHSNAEYYNGALLSAEKSTSNIMPNMMGLDPLKDSDLMPEEILTKEELQALAESLEGEKTYFSNGMVESVKGKVSDLEIEAHFNPNGEVVEIITNEKKYNIGDYSIVCTSIIDENYKKITDVFYRGGKGVTIEKDGNFKEAYFSEKGKITSYYEGEIDEDGERDYELSLYYNDKGMLTSAFNR